MQTRLISLLLIIVVAFSAGMIVGSIYQFPFGANSGKKVDTVNFALDWIPSGSRIWFYVALDKGFYADNGISVQISRGFGSADNIKRVQLGSLDFSFADVGSLIRMKAEDSSIKVKVVSQTIQETTWAVFFLKGRGINTPKDMEGKRMADVNVGSFLSLISRGALTAMGVDSDKVERVYMGEAYSKAIFTGQAEVSADPIHALADYQQTAKEAGLDPDSVGFFWAADYGFKIYGHALITSQSLIDENPDLVKRFVEASDRGLKYALENQDEAVDIILKYVPELERNVTTSHYEGVIPVILSGEAKEKGIGFMKSDVYEATINELVKAGLINSANAPQATDLFDDRFWTTFIPVVNIQSSHYPAKISALET